jgi:hypothetical protein
MRCAVLIVALLAVGACGRRHATPALPERARTVDWWVIPAGTTVSLRTVSRIEANRAVPNESFAAVVVSDVMDSSGNRFLSSGSPAKLVVLPEGLGLAAVMVYGSWYAVNQGAAAPLGTLVQGVLDTHITADPGQSTAIRTTGDRIQVPAGALLIFRLGQPANVESGAAQAASR